MKKIGGVDSTISYDNVLLKSLPRIFGSFQEVGVAKNKLEKAWQKLKQLFILFLKTSLT